MEQYNLATYSAEEFFNELKNYIQYLDHEDKRTVREGLSEKDLAVFDLMSMVVPLNEKEINEVKQIAKELVNNMKEILVIDWGKKQRRTARVRNFIEEKLDVLPDSFDDDFWPKICSDIYMHIYEKYSGQGQSVYVLLYTHINKFWGVIAYNSKRRIYLQFYFQNSCCKWCFKFFKYN
ncbi:type I restriction enzyme endonuclease domain-containing protein [Shewanella sp. WE21]|uniref:type I restriction enzyme endonuclease domain-containing protein n=1 Tax=Shewanella sp. WE21 TaxID=2029986 RepID=UPI0020B16547|nr:type I restriction enzyme endonuclease domain-containing protein [Shewanella sp. WE21]